MSGYYWKYKNTFLLDYPTDRHPLNNKQLHIYENRRKKKYKNSKITKIYTKYI